MKPIMGPCVTVSNAKYPGCPLEPSSKSTQSTASKVVSAGYAPSFAFASSLEPDHVLFGFEADTKRLFEIVYLFRGRLLLGCTPLLSLLLGLLAGSA